ncbi:MAG: molybdopterin-dependent oxidoreductase [Anaerolineales bacterium]|nr:molybdopterin-dependent oxidoreductase [Anaerolineales bacterium]
MHGGQAAGADHGYPPRLLVPKKYFWKSAKWVRFRVYSGRSPRLLGALRISHMRGDPGRKNVLADH